MSKIKDVIKQIQKNEIVIKLKKAKKIASDASKFGGMPYLPSDFVWPRYEGADYDENIANRPLSFLGQFNLAEIKKYDSDHLLPETGLLCFFYEMETGCWGFDPKDAGCSRVYYFENTDGFVVTDFPEDLSDDYKIKEYALSFKQRKSLPGYEEIEYHVPEEADIEFEELEEYLEEHLPEEEFEQHKLLGYADVIQSEMLTECERTTRGLYCGDAESYQNTSEDDSADIELAARNWTLLFQMASIMEDDYELLWGDCGNLYFYIQKQDLKEKNFDKAWLILQCG